MKPYIEDRIIEVAKFMIYNNATVRETADKFQISKSTVYNDVAKRLLYIDPNLAVSVSRVLEANKNERHIRGGLATKNKYILTKKL